MRRLLIISPHFPPDSTAGTHRARLLAPHLAAHGWRPTVLTVDPRDYEGRLDPVLAASVPPDLHVVRCRAWPVPITRPFGVGDLGLRALPALRRRAGELLARERFHAVFITIYPTYPALLGPGLKRRFGVPFVLDYQDPWVGEWGRSVGGGAGGRADLKSRASRALAEVLEPIALRAADAITAVSRATFEQALARNPDVRPEVTMELPIGWDRGDFDLMREHAASRPRRFDPETFRIAYVGTLLPTGTETLRALFAAIERLRRSAPALAGRLRLRFVGTSNQRSIDPAPRVLPIAREFGLEAIVAEEPSRLDYFDAMQALVESDAVLLLGSREAHYTPSKVFPALLSERPLLALYHEASPVVDLLRRVGGPPAIRLVTYGDRRPVREEADAVAAALREMLADRGWPHRSLDFRPLESTSAYALAGRLAGLLDALPGDREPKTCVRSA